MAFGGRLNIYEQYNRLDCHSGQPRDAIEPGVLGLLSILRRSTYLIDKLPQLGGLLLKLIDPQFQDVPNADHASNATSIFDWKMPNIS